jgi:SMC interacting uncharacterized protein involved in chromosome segregation
MSDSPKYTVQLDEEAVKEIKEQVFRNFRDRWDIIDKENIELKKEIQELKDEIQELKDENEKLIEMGIDLSGWIYSLAKYSSDANNKLKANVWFEGVKRKYFSEVTYGGNK